MNKIKLLFYAGLALLSLNGHAQTYTADKLMIIDGDTIKVKGTTKSIRLIQIDTPEKYHSSKSSWDSYYSGYSTKDITALGKLSSAQLSLCIKFNTITINIVPGDAEGRFLGLIDDKVLECMNGYYYINNDTNISYGSSFIMTQLELAKKSKLGLWKINYDLMDKLNSRAMSNLINR